MKKQTELFSPADLYKLELEKDFQARVVATARINGWTVYSIPDSRRATLSGYPDLTMWRGKRLIFAELKRERGRISPHQEVILGELRALGFAEVYLWRPSQWDKIAQTLAK